MRLRQRLAGLAILSVVLGMAVWASESLGWGFTPEELPEVGECGVRIPRGGDGGDYLLRVACDDPLAQFQVLRRRDGTVDSAAVCGPVLQTTAVFLLDGDADTDGNESTLCLGDATG